MKTEKFSGSQQEDQAEFLAHLQADCEQEFHQDQKQRGL
jgi:hypothetical protein